MVLPGEEFPGPPQKRRRREPIARRNRFRTNRKKTSEDVLFLEPGLFCLERLSLKRPMNLVLERYPRSTVIGASCSALCIPFERILTRGNGLASGYFARLATAAGAGLWYHELGTHIPLTTPAKMMQRYITTDLFFMTTTSATVDSPCGGRRLHPEGAGPLHFQGITLVTSRGIWLITPWIKELQTQALVGGWLQTRVDRNGPASYI